VSKYVNNLEWLRYVTQIGTINYRHKQHYTTLSSQSQIISRAVGRNTWGGGVWVDTKWHYLRG